MRVWYETVGGGQASEPVACLAEAGFALYPVNGVAEGPGLLLFEALDPEVVSRVAERSGRGRRRVLAVAAGPGPAPAGTWELLAAGASDVLTWTGPETAALVAARLRRWQQVDRLLEAPAVCDHLVGESRAWRAVLRRAVEVARYTSAGVLLSGETGTGKELVARLLHTLDARPEKGRLVVLDCTTVVPDLAGSEFFGHEKGAFTNAVAAREGAFAMADGGTLFLDEVGELPLTLQAELLRVVQEGAYKPVGSNTWRTARFRLICATHRDLAADVEAGRFRADLYHRLAAVRIRLPPLRERRDDVLALARHFFREHAPAPPDLSPAVREYLLTRPYPGNVRELSQVVARLASRHVGPGPVTAGAVPEDDRPEAADCALGEEAGALDEAVLQALARGMGLKDIADAASNAAVRLALQAEGSTKGAARRLGVSDRAVQLRVAKWRQNGGAEAG